MTIHFPEHRIEYNRDTGTVAIRYPDGAESVVKLNPDHEHHARKLQLSPGDFNLLHELCHQVVSFGRGVNVGAHGCRIVYRAAHGKPQQFPEAGSDEHTIMSFAYHCMDRRYDYVQLARIEWDGGDVEQMKRDVVLALNALQRGARFVALDPKAWRVPAHGFSTGPYT